MPTRSKRRPQSKNTREAIKKLATTALIKNGYLGTNFRELASRLGITTTNIHYHFGSKQRLIDEVIHDYVVDAVRRQAEVWLAPDLTLRQKIMRVAEMNQQRYQRFNKGARSNRPWSLIGRMRLESSLLSATASADLASFAQELNLQIDSAVAEAIERGELRPDTPRETVAFVLLNVVNSSSVFSHDAGGFKQLAHLFETISDLIFSAFGHAGARPSAHRRSSKTDLSGELDKLPAN